MREAIDLFKSNHGELENCYISPAGHQLFDTNPDKELLDNDRKELFHTITTKLLYIMKGGRPDIELAVSLYVQEFGIQV